MERVQRLDFAGSVRGVVETPQGGRRMPAVLTRVGVLRYTDDTGREWGELRPPEEVFSPDSLATLRGATVVDLHPDDPVTTENFQALSLGHVHDDVVSEDDRLVVATLTVNAGPAVQKIDAGERKDVSCGYSMRPDRTPGVWNGEPYDVVQRDIRYNHVGIGPPGWGRAGEEVSLRLDGAAVQVRDGAPKGNDKAMKKLKLRKREYNLDAEDEVKAAQSEADEMVKKADTDTAALDGLQKALQDALGQVAVWRAKAEAAASTAAPAVTEEMVPEPVADSLVTKRLSLLTDARKVLGNEWKPERNDSGKVVPMSSAEIKRAVVAKALPETKLDGLSTDTIEGMYRACVAGASTRTDSQSTNPALGDVQRIANEADREDGEDPFVAMQTATANRWKTPLTHTSNAPVGGARA